MLISVNFNSNVLLSLPKRYWAILNHLEVEYISFERNQPFKVKNTLMVDKWFWRSEKHFAGIKTRNVDVCQFPFKRVTKLTKGLLGHSKPFGSGIHSFCAKSTMQVQKHVYVRKVILALRKAFCKHKNKKCWYLSISIQTCY